MPKLEKIVVVTKQTALEELVERFNTRTQARFYIEHLGASFAEYEAAHEEYQRALSLLKSSLPGGSRNQFIERSMLSTFTFGETDLVVTLGPDGLVVNTAKYLASQPLLALNPDRSRVDGILVPYGVEQAAKILPKTLQGQFAVKKISMAKAELNDGQVLYAVNDLFIGQRTHVSARYALRYQRQEENQSSSGIIVSTGAGSTGWLRSVITGAVGVVIEAAGIKKMEPDEKSYRSDWEADSLTFSVREPFISKISSANLIFGHISARESLQITSQMPQNGVIFSDGIEADYLQFNSGAIARIGLAEKKLHLVVNA